MERIGKYRLLERLGRGGMGSVFRAHDPALDRFVAIRVVPWGLDITDQQRARVYQMARTWAGLAHPNLVTVYDLGEDVGRFFLVMEFLEGESLAQLLARRASLALDEKLALMIQICDGLHHAHRNGLIYRDLAPDKIVVGRTGQLKLLDSGIARLATTEARKPPHLLSGSSPYTAPELARGLGDPHSDIFSVGAVCYMLLTSRLLLAPHEPTATGRPGFLDAERLHLADSAIPPELAAIVERALREDPTDRFPDVVAMRLELERQLARQTRQLLIEVQTELDELRELKAAFGERLMQANDIDADRPIDAVEALLDEVRVEWTPRENERRARAAQTTAPGGCPPAQRQPTLSAETPRGELRSSPPRRTPRWNGLGQPRELHPRVRPRSVALAAGLTLAIAVGGEEPSAPHKWPTRSPAPTAPAPLAPGLANGPGGSDRHDSTQTIVADTRQGFRHAEMPRRGPGDVAEPKSVRAKAGPHGVTPTAAGLSPGAFTFEPVWHRAAEEVSLKSPGIVWGAAEAREAVPYRFESPGRAVAALPLDEPSRMTRPGRGLADALRELIVGPGGFRGTSGPVTWEVVDLRRELDREWNETRWFYTIWFRENAGRSIAFDHEQRATGPDRVEFVAVANTAIEQRLGANSELQLAVMQRAATTADGFDRGRGELWVWHRFSGHNDRGDKVRVDVRLRLDRAGSGHGHVRMSDR